MKTYIVSETYACYVKWTRIVHAANESDALEAFNEGEGESVDYSPEIGDVLDYLGSEYAVNERHEMPVK